jgi:hypothetical protein
MTPPPANFTGDDYGIAMFSMVQLSLSIICVCFPAVKMLFHKYFPAKPATPGTKSHPQCFQLSASVCTVDARPNGLIKTMQYKISSLFGKEQISSTTLVDEESPPMAKDKHEPESFASNGIPPSVYT